MGCVEGEAEEPVLAEVVDALRREAAELAPYGETDDRTTREIVGRVVGALEGVADRLDGTKS